VAVREAVQVCTQKGPRRLPSTLRKSYLEHGVGKQEK
jgi:hypothetical protein